MICVQCGISLSLMIDCVVSLTGTGMLLLFCCREWLDWVLIMVPVAILFFKCSYDVT